MDSNHIQNVMEQWFSNRSKRPINLRFSGCWFAGRPEEAPQNPISFSVGQDKLIINFEPTERLTIIEPEGIKIVDDTQNDFSLIIPVAERAVFGWHYYGRPQTAENWCEEAYFDKGQAIEMVRTGKLLPETKQLAKTASNFVELL